MEIRFIALVKLVRHLEIAARLKPRLVSELDLTQSKAKIKARLDAEEN